MSKEGTPFQDFSLFLAVSKLPRPHPTLFLGHFPLIMLGLCPVPRVPLCPLPLIPMIHSQFRGKFWH